MGRKKIVCFGDSLTWGFDPDTHLRMADEGRWTTVMKKNLGDDYEVIEEGQCGRTIATDDPAEGEKSGIRYIVPCLESHNPLDLLIIMLGTNDCKRKFSYSARDIAGEMQRMVEKVLAFNRFKCGDSFKVLIVAPPKISNAVTPSWLGDMFGYDSSVKVSADLADWYKQVAEMYGCLFMDASEYAVVSESDGIHMDAANQAKLGEQMAKFVKENI